MHSCAHALGTVVDMHHGLANGIMIDHVMRFNLDAARGEDGGARARVRRGHTATSFVEWLAALKARIGIPAQARRARREEREHMPRSWSRSRSPTRCRQTNPRPVTASRGLPERIFAGSDLDLYGRSTP